MRALTSIMHVSFYFFIMCVKTQVAEVCCQTGEAALTIITAVQRLCLTKHRIQGVDRTFKYFCFNLLKKHELALLQSNT